MKIRYKIGLFSILVALVPMLIIGITGYYKGVDMLLDKQKQAAQISLQRAEDQIIKMLEENKRIASILAKSIEHHGIKRGFHTFDSVIHEYKDYLYAYFAEEKNGGFHIAPPTPMPEGFDPRTRPWYHIATDKTPKVSAPFVDVVSGKIIVTVSRAVFKGDKKIGVIGIDLDLTRISQQVTDIKIGESGYAFVLYKDGTTLIHGNPEFIGKKTKFDFIEKMIQLKNGQTSYDFNGKKIAVVRTLEPYGWTLAGGTYYKEIKKPMAMLKKFNLAIGGITLILVIGGILAVTASITAPLISITLNLGEIARGEGDLTRRLKVGSKDEIGSLAASFNTFVEKLWGMIKGIAGDAATLDASSHRILKISKELTQGTQSMAKASRSVSKASEKMSHEISTTASTLEASWENIHIVTESVDEMNQTIHEIAQNTKQTKDSSYQAVLKTQAATNRIQKLDAAARDIGNIVDAINEISDQTDLLSLNAAIEAARAGSAGKGFTVVANEIKELSRQTAQAANGIKEKIEGIQRETQETIADIQSVSGEIDGVNTMVDGVAAAVEQQSGTTQKITNKVNLAASGIQTATQAIQQSKEIAANIASQTATVNKAIQDLAEKTTQVDDCSHDLNQLSGNLERAITLFKF